MFFLSYLKRELKRNLIYNFLLQDKHILFLTLLELLISVLSCFVGIEAKIKTKQNNKPSACFLLSRKKQLNLNFLSPEQIAKLTVLQCLKALKH